MSTSARTALCLECRTALAFGERCDLGARHRVARLDVPTERRLAVDAVWGPLHLRGRRIAKVGGAGGGLGGLFDGCGGCGGCDGASLSGEAALAILVVVIAAFAAIALWWIVTRIVHAVRAHRARVRPRGAAARRVPPRPVLRGTVGAAREAAAPISGAACAAWGLALRHDDAIGGDLMLRDGATAGFELVLDDGRRVRVPAGRIRLDGPADRVDPAAYLRRLDPLASGAEEHPPVPCDRAEEVLLRAVDTVELHGAVEERPDPHAASAGYREAAPTCWLPVGVPTLSRVDA